MDKEKLFKHLNQRYSSKRDIVSRIPLGIQPDPVWRELLDRRRSRSTVLPLYGRMGTPYWYVTTDKMVTASEKIVEELYENNSEFDPYTGPASVSTLEEVFYTGFVEGVQLSMQAAMEFLTSGMPPRDIEEQIITNNRQAGNYAAANLYRPIDADFLCELAYILTDGMDNGGHALRETDEADFVSPNGEEYEFTPAYMLPDRVGELCSFLEMTDVHPLIKAAAAQAYILILRPFQEGNERLSRILSYMILLRAGYSFFGDISLSALAAKRSYAYFEAVANIMRDENGGDITYFLEYFIELLSRAVDERRLRLRQNAERERQAERELARSALIPVSEPAVQTAPEKSIDQHEHQPSAVKEGGEIERGFFTAERDDSYAADKSETVDILEQLFEYAHNGGYAAKTVVKILTDRLECGETSFTTMEIKERCDLTEKQVSNVIVRLREKDLIKHSDMWDGRRKRYIFNFPADYVPNTIKTVKGRLNDESNIRQSSESTSEDNSFRSYDEQDIDRSDDEICLARVREKLYEYAAGHGDIMKKCALQLLEFMDRGKVTFTVKDIESRIGVNANRIGKRLMRLRQKDLIERCGGENGRNLAVYRFSLRHPPLEQKDYDPEVIEIVNRLHNIDSRSRAYRINKVTCSCIPKGLITAEDYEKAGYSGKLEADMKLPEQLGIVQKICDGVYKLCRKRKYIAPELTGKQKSTIAVLYKAFRRKEFNTKAVMSALNISKSRANAILLQLKILRALDCRKDGLGHLYWLSEAILEHEPQFNEAEETVRIYNTEPAHTETEPSAPVYSDDVYELLDRLDDHDASAGDRRIGGFIRKFLFKGEISLSDYLSCGYTKYMWQKDIALARQLGLVSLIGNGCYSVSRELRSASSKLTQYQKQRITALYEAFGDQNFSSEMYVATLNYSNGHSWAMLHTLTLMKVLDHKDTDEGIRYQLLVNPEENPEYFDIAA